MGKDYCCDVGVVDKFFNEFYISIMENYNSVVVLVGDVEDQFVGVIVLKVRFICVFCSLDVIEYQICVGDRIYCWFVVVEVLEEGCIVFVGLLKDGVIW